MTLALLLPSSVEEKMDRFDRVESLIATVAVAAVEKTDRGVVGKTDPLPVEHFEQPLVEMLRRDLEPFHAAETVVVVAAAGAAPLAEDPNSTGLLQFGLAEMQHSCWSYPTVGLVLDQVNCCHCHDIALARAPVLVEEEPQHWDCQQN